jgi:hypothetical protein
MTRVAPTSSSAPQARVSRRQTRARIGRATRHLGHSMQGSTERLGSIMLSSDVVLISIQEAHDEQDL